MRDEDEDVQEKEEDKSYFVYSHILQPFIHMYI